MRVAVIGGAGYIGSHVVLALQEAGHEPIIFDNLSTGLQENIDATGAPFFRGDVQLEADLLRFFDKHKPEAVIHLAAWKAAGESMEKPEKYSKNNIAGSIELLNAMLLFEVPYFVFSSSAAVYGSPQFLPITEEHPTEPENYYGFTKLEIERISNWYKQLKGLKVANLRYFNAVGYDPQKRVSGKEKNPQNLFPIIMEAATGLREKIVVFGTDYDTEDGSCVRDYVHVTDLADAHVRALSYLENAGSITVNLGTGNGLSVLECINAAKKHMGEFTVEMGPRRAGDPDKLWADSSKAKELLGWTPKHSDPDTIISSMASVYKS